MVFNPNLNEIQQAAAEAAGEWEATIGQKTATMPPTPPVPTPKAPAPAPVAPAVVTKDSPAAANYAPVGNPAVDIPILSSMGASNVQLTNYMAQYGQGWNYNYLATSGDNSAMGKTNKILTDAGVTKAFQDVNAGKGTFYSFDNPAKPGSKIQIPAAIYDKASPTQQFALLQQYGVVSKTTKLIVNTDGSWGYTDSNASTSKYCQWHPQGLVR